MKRKKIVIFEVTKILDRHVKAYTKLISKDLEKFDYWYDWIDRFVISTPWRDNIVKYNEFLCEIYYLFKDFNTENYGPEIIDETNKILINIRFNYKLIENIIKLRETTTISLKEQIHINLLTYLSNIESNLVALLSLLFKVFLMRNSKIKISKLRNIKPGDQWVYKDTSMPIPQTTTMILKEICETKEIIEINQLSELSVREISRAFKQNGFPKISEVLFKLCNFDLRNNIAHGKYDINPYKKIVTFSDSSIMTFNRFKEEGEKLEILFRLIFVGIYLSIIIIDHNIDLVLYEKKY